MYTVHITEEELSRDVVFRLLSHSYRRALLECLDRYESAIAVADAAEEVARESTGKPRSDVSAERIREVHLSLYHSHVPQLDAEDVVAYDRERELVSLTDRGTRLVAVLDRLSSPDPLEEADLEG